MNKNWWKTFFKPLTAEIMFKPRLGKQTQREVEKVLSVIDSTKKLNILDLCCGEGRHSHLFAKKHTTTGLDYSKEFLKVAKYKTPEKVKSNLKFVRGGIRARSKSIFASLNRRLKIPKRACPPHRPASLMWTRNSRSTPSGGRHVKLFP